VQTLWAVYLTISYISAGIGNVYISEGIGNVARHEP
jgi:hypothetical protein